MSVTGSSFSGTDSCPSIGHSLASLENGHSLATGMLGREPPPRQQSPFFLLCRGLPFGVRSLGERGHFQRTTRTDYDTRVRRRTCEFSRDTVGSAGTRQPAAAARRSQARGRARPAHDVGERGACSGRNGKER
eukprot:scaffold105327_cov69-Phaeocystis_antarctica.AAC.8